MSAAKEDRASQGRAMAAELRQEAATTRRMLERLPEDKFAWKPHPKSMSLIELAGHIVEMVGWTDNTVLREELDFATLDYKPTIHETTASLLELFDQNVTQAAATLERASDEELAKTWTMRKGETVYFAMPREAVMRSMVLNHVVHHRGQLSVYIRLLDVPVPQIYGPSADEGTM